MRGVILAGGTGSRLDPLTKTANKHTLMVGGIPMIHHPLRVLLDNNINDVTIVSSPGGVRQLHKLLGLGDDCDVKFTYCVQDQPNGIAAALREAQVGRLSSDREPIAVVLGDNVFLPSPIINTDIHLDSCRVFLAKVSNPVEFGVPEFNAGGQIVRVVEKPETPLSEYVVTGLYVFGASVFERLRYLLPSRRGELEITDLLNEYILGSGTIIEGFWGDAGTPQGLLDCSLAYEKWVNK